ncbi:MAG: collagen-like protein [Bacteroidota bacterium]
MKNYTQFRMICLLALVAFIFGCSAEDGSDGTTGPQGEQGIQGEQGPPGEQGPAGTDGADGIDANSTVISSGWFEIDTWDTDISNFKFHRIPDLILTDFQIENNVFLVYRRYQQSPSFFTVDLLPLYQLDVNGDIELSIQQLLSGNGMFLQIESFGRAVASEEYLGPDTQFRYMIIEPASTSDKKKNVDFSKMSYQEVVEYLGINP